MPFDKHIIGQVPAVIRPLFNVSKLGKEQGAPGPRAIHSPLPSPLDISWAAREGPMSCGVTQRQVFFHTGMFGQSPSFIPKWRWSTGGETLENLLHTDRQRAVCWKARSLYFITGMWQEACSLMSFKYAPLISCSEPHQDGWVFFFLILPIGKADTVVRCSPPRSASCTWHLLSLWEKQDIFKLVSILLVVTFQVDCNI